MALNAKIKHVDQRPNGVLRFRRRFPKDVAEALGQPALQVHIRNRDGLAFHQEYQAILRDFDRVVAETRAQLDGNDTRSPIDRWHDALMKREGLIAETIGLEDDPEFAARLISEGLSNRRDTDPLLIKALVNPDAEAPKLTLQDGKNMYAKDKRLPDGEIVRLDRITKRLEEALGPLDEVTIEGLRRDHGRRYMELMLKTKKRNGQPLSIATCDKESKIIAAMVNHAMREGDVDIKNPFISLPWPKDAGPKVNKKLPLPDDLIGKVEVRLNAGRTGELPLIWRLLKGTGMRLGEVAGLAHDDLVLDGETPHVLVRPNSIRDLKTASSNRSVPLVGDALAAAKEAIKSAQTVEPIFPRYARDRGADAASAALMKAVRNETKDKRFTVHGLRHRVSDKLRDAGAPVEVRHGFLGHSSAAIAESTYGSPEARLKEFMKWAGKAEL
ncbi:tyrosine-type recombinase/integrase [uncultured Roseobacter sp.]|uniref:tyrosine-type recombinase/integrase n=1 Tax=uncultured Roseobacter sp. TaxID=114847 RepID=UPI002611B311|nr:tyrosine-type recombinase/integrase [uncultured Roseobacter sp.]